jgi:hypothetical protein
MWWALGKERKKERKNIERIFFVLFHLFYGAVPNAAFVVRNKKWSFGIVSANGLRREFAVCMKIVYGFGRDSELVLTNDEHESWRVHLLVEWIQLRYRGCCKASKVLSPEDS